jgi:capsular exopolysaccharide synthesis family protein
VQRTAAVRLQEERKFLLSSRSDFYVREAYKILRTNVSFALTGEEKSKVIVVTSSLQSEGKSITAANLAISYAMTDRKVLLVDCDMRRPKLARLMNTNSKVGLSNLLMDPSLKEEAILSTSVSGLDVLLAGDIPPNPSELLSSPRMQRLIAELREQYDFVILDSPPINMVTDAVVIAPQSDGVLFLVRANHSERGAVIHAVEQLEYAKAKILGFVLNGVEMENTHYGYGKYRYKRYARYSRYGYGHGYGHGYGYGYSRGYGYGYGYSSRVMAEPEAEEPAAEEKNETV